MPSKRSVTNFRHPDLYGKRWEVLGKGKRLVAGGHGLM
jgi:hypothetical protein